MEKIDGLTHTHDSSLHVKGKDMKPTEHNTEPSSVCKLNKGDIEGKIIPGTTKKKDSLLTKLHGKDKTSLTHIRDTSVSY